MSSTNNQDDFQDLLFEATQRILFLSVTYANHIYTVNIGSECVCTIKDRDNNQKGICIFLAGLISGFDYLVGLNATKELFK